jgi:hypothetical protein
MTITMVTNLKAAVLVVNPSSDFDEVEILKNGTLTEKF